MRILVYVYLCNYIIPLCKSVWLILFYYISFSIISSLEGRFSESSTSRFESNKESHPRQKIPRISLTRDLRVGTILPFFFPPFHRCPTRASSRPLPRRSPLGAFIFHTLLIRKWWCSGRWRVPVMGGGWIGPGDREGRKVVFQGGKQGDRTLARGSHD